MDQKLKREMQPSSLYAMRAARSLAEGALSRGGLPAPFAMVASQHRVPRIYPLPKKVLSHGVFRALLERRRHTLDSLIVLLNSGTERGDKGNLSDKLPNGEDPMQIDGNEEAERGPPAESAGPHCEDKEAGERTVEVGNNGAGPAGAVEEEREGEAEEGNEEGSRLGNFLDAAERDGLNGGLAAEGDEGTRARGNIDQDSEVLPNAEDDALTRNGKTVQDLGRETPQEEEGEASPSAEGEERKAVEKAELEEQLNKLESKKHKLVQQLKQVLVREDSRKFVRPPLTASPVPSPSSLTVSPNYYMPNASPLPSASSSHPSPLATANQFTAPLKKDDEALEEGELPDGGSPHRNAKPQVESERGPSAGIAGDWDRPGERTRLMHSASWDQRNDRYYLGGERASVVSPKAGFGSRMGSPYYQPLSLRRNFSLGPTVTGPNRFPLRSTGSGIGLENMLSPQDPMLPSPLGDSLGGPSPGAGMSNFQSRSRGK
ncbi:hypothetical protein KFL_001700130 [Klebsormidium nitens]|uniref:Uncharacterized protein n=1 Tax=Klebsormidium nitens TaxID=105231 RepID=A0A1Y1I779_KLENI|nr:hypothetical protein KFL_001700130 [Klebsormidium nitens]|eukprot:GAQ83958.1 hypothetical protein KFL_001700130 [Klebsormidium nitens]